MKPIQVPDLKNMSNKDKLAWVRSDAGFEYFKQLLDGGKSIKTITMNYFYYAENRLTEWQKRAPRIAGLIQEHNQYRRSAVYRIVVNHRRLYDYTYTGHIVAEAETPEELWDSDYVKNHFKSFKLSHIDYFDSYMDNIRRNGCYQLSYRCILIYSTLASTLTVQKQVPPQIIDNNN